MADNAAELARLEAAAEKAYADMYEAHNQSGAGACFSEAKECFSEAIALAQRMGAAGDAARLQARLEHVKAVFRSQFT